MWIDLFSEVSVSVNYWSCKRDWNISVCQKKIAKAKKKTIKKKHKHRLEENSKIYMGIKKILLLVKEESSFRWEKL